MFFVIDFCFSGPIKMPTLFLTRPTEMQHQGARIIYFSSPHIKLLRLMCKGGKSIFEEQVSGSETTVSFRQL